MKASTLLIALVVGFLTASVSAQEIIWFDSNWNQTVKDKAVYYRPVPKKEGNKFLLIDYYMNGTKQMEGYSLTNTIDKEKFVGLVKYYFENGKTYQKVNYTNGILDGQRYISGGVKSEVVYEDGKKEGKYLEYYETGELSTRGDYESGMKDGIWKTYYNNGKIKERGKYDKGKKVGIWKTFYKNVYK